MALPLWMVKFLQRGSQHLEPTPRTKRLTAEFDALGIHFIIQRDLLRWGRSLILN
jgi:hypothetical protein